MPRYGMVDDLVRTQTVARTGASPPLPRRSGRNDSSSMVSADFGPDTWIQILWSEWNFKSIVQQIQRGVKKKLK